MAMTVDRSLIKTLALFEATALSLLVIMMWFAAFANDGTVTLYIDRFGEAGVEYLMWLVLTPILVLGLHYYMVDED
jgi:hypothetical protein